VSKTVAYIYGIGDASMILCPSCGESIREGEAKKDRTERTQAYPLDSGELDYLLETYPEQYDSTCKRCREPILPEEGENGNC
jgi:hypothetical protein